MHQQDSFDITEEIVEFCRFARTNGFSAGVTETVDSLQAAAAIASAGRETFKSAMRAELCSSKEEWDIFDRLFEEFWSGSARSSSDRPDREEQTSQPKARSQEMERERAAIFATGEPPARPAEEEGSAFAGASVLERIRKMDFSEVPASDQAVLERLAERLLKQMTRRLSRRLKIAELRGQVDLRRTIRKNIGRGGEPIDLRFKGKKLQQAQIVILLDVSGSMNLYSMFLLKFAHALQKHFKRAGTFIFSTEVHDVTGALRTRKLADAFGSLSEIATGWSGGTKIGDSLREFNRIHAKKSMSRDTFVIILSDGWDTGEPEVLAAELRALKRRASKVVWLNPLLGLHDYQPITRGMAAALPHVDVFAPAHSLESLLELERHLTRGIAR
jgi:uncharacterized protein